MELSDFNQTQPLTVGDFGKLPPVGPTVNEKSAAQIAGALSVLQGGDPAEYQKNKKDLLDPASREQFIQKHAKLRDMLWEDAQSSLPSLLADPSVTDQTKQGVASTITMSKLPPLDTLKTLAEEASIADSGVNETEREATARNSMLENVEMINRQKRQLQTMINGLHLGEDAGAIKTLKDVGELVAPFAEWLHYDSLSKEMDPDGYEFKLLGQKKAELYDKIKQIPIDQRQLFAEQLVDLITANKNVLLPDGNDIVALQDLQRMLIDDDYTNTERWIDNVTSVLDVAGVGGIVRFLRGGEKVIKAGEALNKAAEGASATQKGMTLEEEARAFSEAQRAAESTPNALATEASNFKAAPEPTAKDLFPPKPKNTVKSLTEEAKNFKSTPEPTADSVFRDALSESTRTDVSPTSPSQTVKDFNPELSRQLHEVVVQDDTGEAAKALYGTSKTEALAKDILPEPDLQKGKMPNKVEMNTGPETPLPENVRKTIRANGNTIVSDAELGRVKEKLISGFNNIEGMMLHPSSMLTRLNLDGTIGFTARFSPVDAGFKTPEEALANARYAFRHYGLQDENFVLMERQGADWKEISMKDARAKELLKNAKPEAVKANPKLDNVDYSLGMKYDYRFSPDDWDEAERLTVAPGIIARAVQFMDRMPTQFMARLGQGSIVQHVLDAASVIHPQIANAANVAFDRVYGIKKVFVDEFDKFTKAYSGMKADRRALMTDYIHQANLEGLKLNEANLYSRGFTEKEVETLKVWRRANDIMWYAANDDMVLSLRSKGFQAFVHDESGTKLFGRPMAARTAYAEKYVFDPVANKVVQMDKADIDKMYEAGGTMFRIGEPTKIDGHWVDVVISKNTPNGGYMRKIYDGEKVLAYRDGYYPVAYDANYFVQKTIRRQDGTEGHKVLVAAKTRQEAEEAIRKLQADDAEGVYSFRTDRSLRLRANHIFDEGAWNLSANSGVTSQRIRGERLADAGMDLEKMGNAHLKDPLHAVQQQIHQLSQRTAVRPFLDAAKKRWMINYGKYIDLKRGEKSGQIEMPSNIADVIGKPGAPEKLVADARTSFNYISGLENGYINMIDETYKGILHAAAQFAGEKGLGGVEKALFAGSKISPTQKLRTLAFKLFISSSPGRQAIIQRGQMLSLGAVNPKYVGTRMLSDLWGVNKVRAGWTADKRFVELYEEIKDAGILEAVDAHNLIRDDMLHMADVSTGAKVIGALNKPLEIAQKVGFDLAEQDVLLSSWLAHRDLALKAGKNIKSQRVKDEILGQARAFTLSMNRAGDMPYTQNTMSVAAQFFSFRHKAILQGLTNRSLKPMDRAKLLAYTTALFGVDAGVLYYVYKLIPQDQPNEARQALEDGLLSVTLNRALTLASGKEQAIDWGDLAPTEAKGVGDTFVAMLDSPISSIIAGGPSSSLLFGQNPKLTDAFKTGLRYFNIIDDYKDEELNTRFSDVVKASASTFSGFSSMFKARYAFATGQKLSTSGRTSDGDVTGVEAVMAAFGFRTKTETGYQDVRDIQFGDRTYEATDVQAWYKELKRHLTRRGDTKAVTDMQQRVLAEAWRVFGDDRPRAIEVIRKEIQKDAQDGDYVVFKGILSQMGLATEEEVWQMINALPDGPGKQNLTGIMNYREEQADGN